MALRPFSGTSARRRRLLLLATGLAAALAPGCRLDPSGKNGCFTTNDCLPGFVCQQSICVPPDSGMPTSDGGRGGAAGRGGAGGTGGSAPIAGSAGIGGSAGTGGTAGTGETAGTAGTDATAGAGAVAGDTGGTGAVAGSGGTAGSTGGTGAVAGSGGTAGSTGGTGAVAGTGGMAGNTGGTGAVAGTGGTAGDTGGTGAVAGTGGTAGDTGGTGAGAGTAGTAGDTGGTGAVAGTGGTTGGTGGTGGVAGTGGTAGDTGGAGAVAGTGGTTAGSGGTGGVTGTGGTTAGTGGVAPPGVLCTASTVTTCPAPTPGRCEQIFCGGRMLMDRSTGYNQLVPYRIFDPEQKFTAAYRSAIHAGAAAWANASSRMVKFEVCSPCSGRFVSVMPGDGDDDGVIDVGDEQVLLLPVDAASLANPPRHRIAHQWGHVLGLGHTYERADRDRYVRFDPAAWCGTGRPGLPPRCAASPPQVGGPPIPTDTFGVYDEKSKMNGFAADGICGSSEPDPASDEPTPGDTSAVQELFYSPSAHWAPFQPLGRSVSPTQPLDYQLAPGVDPVGAPAPASWAAPALEIFVRGTDRAIYGIRKLLSNTTVFEGWSAWEPVLSGADSEPAALFTAAGTLVLAVRGTDKAIHLRARVNGTWGPLASVGGPASGAASAPSIAVRGDGVLSVVVRGSDDLVHVLTCTDPGALCQVSAAAPDAWTALQPVSVERTLVGRPSASWSGSWLFITAVTDDATPWLIGGLDVDFRPSLWYPLNLDVDPTDPEPFVPIVYHYNFMAINARRAINNGDGSFLYPPLGGVLASALGVAFPPTGLNHIYVAALIEDHGRPGVWLKYHGGPLYAPPCNYNAPGTCADAECGCGGYGAPACY